MDIECILKNLKEMLVERGDDISMFEEHELSIDKEDYENDKSVIELQTSNTTIIFALTKKLRKMIIDELKLYDSNIENFISKYGNMKNIILIFNNDTISIPIISQLNKYDKLFQKIGGQLQYFHIKQLMFNPTKHEYVPKHIKLSEENAIKEKEELKNKIKEIEETIKGKKKELDDMGTKKTKIKDKEDLTKEIIKLEKEIEDLNTKISEIKFEITDFMKEYMIKSKIYMPIILHSDPIAKWLGLKQGDIVKIIRYNENSGISFYYRTCF